MAALSADRNTEYSLGDLLSIPVAATETIYAGALVCTDADGYAVPAADTAGLTFAGVATARADNASGADAAISVVVRRRGRYKLDYQGWLTQAGMSAKVYVVNDQTVDAANGTTNDIQVGIIAKVEAAGECWVDIDAVVLAGKAWDEPTTTTAGA